MEVLKQEPEDASPVRVACYVDGCNLYHGMRESKLREYYWLDLNALANDFVRKGQLLVYTKYFTAVVKGNPGKAERHTTYIDALAAGIGVQTQLGFFQQEPFYCGNCHNRRPVPKEKQTDTNITAALLTDAFLDRWDVALLVSADADLVPPIREIRAHFSTKKVIIVAPPNRRSDELRQHANGVMSINAAMLKRCQLPDDVEAPNGIILSRPDKWSSA